MVWWFCCTISQCFQLFLYTSMIYAAIRGWIFFPSPFSEVHWQAVKNQWYINRDNTSSDDFVKQCSENNLSYFMNLRSECHFLRCVYHWSEVSFSLSNLSNSFAFLNWSVLNQCEEIAWWQFCWDKSSVDGIVFNIISRPNFTLIWSVLF
jgi:hypothetical protein